MPVAWPEPVEGSVALAVMVVVSETVLFTVGAIRAMVGGEWQGSGSEWDLLIRSESGLAWALLSLIRLQTGLLRG